MCDVDAQETTLGNINIVCKISGKPITIADQNGMWCEDKCDYEQSTKCLDDLRDLMHGVVNDLFRIK